MRRLTVVFSWGGRRESKGIGGGGGGGSGRVGGGGGRERRRRWAACFVLQLLSDTPDNFFGSINTYHVLLSKRRNLLSGQSGVGKGPTYNSLNRKRPFLTTININNANIVPALRKSKAQNH